MSRQPEEITGEPIKVSTEECSTNFYYTVGETETFSCQMTVRGNPSKVQLAAHVAAAMAGMRAVIAAGGHAKVAKESPSQASSNGNGGGYKCEFETYIGTKGKRFVRIPEGREQPNEITCEIHGKKMKRNSNERGAWYSHKDGEKWCSAEVPNKSAT